MNKKLYIINQGDQLALPLILKDKDGTLITPDNCLGIKVKLGKLLFSSMDDTLLYDTTKQYWYCYLTQEQTLNMDFAITLQVQINFGGTPNIIKNTTPQTIKIVHSIITEVWE